MNDAGGPPSSRRGAVLVASGIALSRVAGLVRERVIARYLGVGVTADAFRAALRIPNLLQNLFGEGVLSASFIPVYSRLVDDGERDPEAEAEAGRVAASVAGLLLVVAGVAAVVGIAAARPLTLLLTPGFEGERLDLTVRLVQIITPGIGLLVLSAWALGVLNSHRRFFLSYVAPVLWNAAQIAAVIGAALWGVEGTDLAIALAWGTVVGGALQLGVQLPTVRRLLGSLRPSTAWCSRNVRDVLRRFGPVVVGRGVVQLVAYVDLVLASLLAVGAVAALGYAQVFYLLPISLFGMSVAAAELPELSRLRAHDARAVANRLDRAAARIAFWVGGVVVAYVVLGDLVVGMLLGTGKFGRDDTRLVWFVLVAYSTGLLAATWSRVLQNARYAVGDTRGPAVIAALRVVLAAAVGAMAMIQLDHVVIDGSSVLGLDQLPAAFETVAGDGRLRLGAVGLAMGAAAGAWLEWALLRRRVRTGGVDTKAAGGHGRGVGGAMGAAAVVALALRPLVRDLDPVVGAISAGVPVAMTYVGASWALAVPEARSLLARVTRDRP